ncbi:MAG: hypothetical protein QXF17_02525 [Ignisphaera sp.]|uniref:Uncharacterized protein n=1 Tax=Ignisphaera aggregans TaxID=334771 RepID=A0A7J3I673_9CREN
MCDGITWRYSNIFVEDVLLIYIVVLDKLYVYCYGIVTSITYGETSHGEKLMLSVCLAVFIWRARGIG